MNKTQFCVARGLTTDADVLGHIHAGLRSAPTTKTYKRSFEKRLAQLQLQRDEANAMYSAAIASGEIIIAKETRREHLMRVARGHPDNAATQAAIRLLARMQAPHDKQMETAA